MGNYFIRVPKRVSKCFQYVDCCTRLRTNGVIEIEISRSNNRIPVDNKTRGHRQCPGIVTVECREVKAKLLAVYLLHTIRESIDQSEFSRHFIAAITEHFERQSPFLDKFTVILFKLGRNGDERRAGCCNFRVGFTQSYQLCITIRSPLPPIK